jgi:hypothetical protein
MMVSFEQFVGSKGEPTRADTLKQAHYDALRAIATLSQMQAKGADLSDTMREARQRLSQVEDELKELGLTPDHPLQFRGLT